MLLDFKRPTMVVNFKSYDNGVGKKALELSKIIEKEAMGAGKRAILCVQPSDIHNISYSVGLPIFAQHYDVVEGPKTGSISLTAIKDAGAKGVLLNHAEKRIEEGLKRHVEIAKSVGLSTLVCVQSAEEAKRVSVYRPDAIAIEVPKLIGTTISITQSKPDLIEAVVKIGIARRIPILCGAGINQPVDVTKAFELGTKGILIASAIVNSEHPGKNAKELFGALR